MRKFRHNRINVNPILPLFYAKNILLFLENANIYVNINL